MGQYFLLVNKTKKQVVDPHESGNGAKFMEIVGSYGLPNILTYLLRQSTGCGGGDIDTVKDMDECISFCKEDIGKHTAELVNAKDEEERKRIQSSIEFNEKCLIRYRKNKELALKRKYAGSWVDDKIALVGDYDESGLYEKANHNYTDITAAVIMEIKEQCDIEIVEGQKYQQDLRPDMIIQGGGE